jgi:hypothetical protein
MPHTRKHLLTPSDHERKAAFVRHWRGTIHGTHLAMKAAGLDVTRELLRRLYDDPAVRQAIRIWTDRQPGVIKKTGLQQFWTRIVDGAECNTVVLKVTEAYVDADGEPRSRVVDKTVEVPPDLPERLKASELLGKSMMAFTDKLELSGGVTLTALLDEDLRQGAIDVEATPAEGADALLADGVDPRIADEVSDLLGLSVPDSVANEANRLLASKPDSIKPADKAMSFLNGSPHPSRVDSAPSTRGEEDSKERDPLLE